MTTGYCGWRNYETWKANLEFFDGFSIRENFGSDDVHVEIVQAWLEGYAEESLFNGVSDNNFVAISLLNDFYKKIDFKQIAEHYLEDFYADDIECVYEE